MYLNNEESFIPTNEQYHSMKTLEENVNFPSLIQQNQAKEAQKLYEAIGTPTVEYLKAMISMNLTKSNVVTPDNVNLSTIYYATDVGSIQGKTTRSRPRTVMDIRYEFLELQQDLTVSMDGLTVNSHRLLFTIFHELYYRAAQYVAKSVLLFQTKTSTFSTRSFI